MTERLGRKLGLDQSPQGSSPKAVRECFTADAGAGPTFEAVTRHGEVWLLPYSRLEWVVMDGDGKAVTIAFASHEMLIEGSNLQKICKAVANFRGCRIEAADRREREPAEGDVVVVNKVEVTPRGRLAEGLDAGSKEASPG